ncbi:MAG: hypothetical protein IJP66_05510 [Kiritimatiellae bacterium]|nr:hypothetical protein [Kiritimatiellia bacterium]
MQEGDGGRAQRGQSDDGMPGATTIGFEREKLVLERERLAIERERLENERLRHRQTVEISNGAAGRVVLPASTFLLSLLVAALLGGTAGAWLVASRFRPTPAAIAESVARAIGSQGIEFADDPDATNGLDAATQILRPATRIARGAGYLLILD